MAKATPSGGMGGVSGGGEDSSSGDGGADAAVGSLRSSIRPTYPEIDALYSDAYLAAVLSVPDRAYEYARDEKIAKALEWRRQYGVEALLAAFRCDEDAGGIFRAKADDDTPQTEQTSGNAATDVSKQPPSALFVPSAYLVDVCLSGAFTFAGFDRAGRGILFSKTALLDWWSTGAEDGIRYHVLVLEHALKKLAERNNSSSKKESTSQSTS
ncbi:hypothetical protein ACHAXT_002554 [Thalassiosira profunda]